MNTALDFRHCRMRALVTLSEVFPEPTPEGASTVNLHTAEDSWSALCWQAPHLGAGTGAMVADVDIVQIGDSELIVTRLERQPDAFGFDFVSPIACPVAGTVRGTRDLVDTLCEPLRRFVRSALSLPGATLAFWRARASLKHHHAHMGGLAEHSLDVATRTAAAMANDPAQRDIAVAYALLHDFGKVWCYAANRMTDEGRLLGHEQVGFERLLPLLLELRHAWPDGGIVMQSLLSGEWKRERTAPVIAAGNVVRSLDQLSAEHDMGDHPDPSRRRWQPRLVK
jgi:hypothetical protein